MVNPLRREQTSVNNAGYREEVRRRHPSAVVFKTPEDLLPVHEIGVGMVHNIEPYLVFPAAGK